MKTMKKISLMLMAALAMLAGHISFRQQGFSLLNTIGALLLMLAVEPVLLHLWGTTPGKRLLGLTVEKPDGRRQIGRAHV